MARQGVRGKVRVVIPSRRSSDSLVRRLRDGILFCLRVAAPPTPRADTSRHKSELMPAGISVIACEADIAAGVAQLVRLCPGMAAAFALVGQPPLRRWTSGFEGLARIIVGQQLSTASASAIFGRLTVAVAPMEPSVLLAADDGVLKGAGLSAAKIATLRALAQAVFDGRVDFSAMASAREDEVRGQLTQVRGIGPWTADIYLMFCCGHADAFAAGDLALQIGAQRLLGLHARPTAAELLAIAEVWRPWRAVAARILWAYYGHAKVVDAKRAREA